jgi:hypothetical protein
MDFAAGKRTILRIALLAATVGLAVAGTWRYRSDLSSRSAGGQQATGLYVDPHVLDVGEVWEDSHLSRVLRIENRSGKDVSIERFYHSCDCTEIEPGSLVVPAGESREIRLTIDLMRQRIGGAANGEGVQEFATTIAAVVPGSGNEKASEEWLVRGRVKMAVQFEQPVVDFGTHSEREQPLPAKRTPVKTFTDLEALSVHGNPAGFPVRVTRRRDDPSRFDLEIVPKADLPVGEHRFDLLVEPIREGGKPLPAKKLPVKAWLAPDLQASPPEIVLGAVPIGESREATFTIGSLTGQAFAVEGWSCRSDRVAVQAEAAPTGIPTYRVKWLRVSAVGEQRADIQFRTTVGGKAGRAVTVPVTCWGIAACAAKR